MRPIHRFLNGLGANISPISVAASVAALGVGVLSELGLAIYAWTQGSLSVFAVGSMMALAATAVGGLAGFLLGLPRYSTVTLPPPDETGSVEHLPTLSPRPSSATMATFTPSNNLEQISDWLTKLLLGAGLVQLGAIGKWLRDLVNSIADAFTVPGAPSSSARIIAGSLLILGAIDGFIFVYMCTAIWYRHVSEQTERAMARMCSKQQDARTTDEK